MTFSVSIYFSFLLTCFFIANFSAGTFAARNVKVSRSRPTPKCLYSDYLYDPKVNACAEPGTKAHCGQNMIFDIITSSSGKIKGGCVCNNHMRTSCWGRPLVPSKRRDRCWHVGQRGPCGRGRALIAVGKNKIQCGPDACAHKKPKNPLTYTREKGSTGEIELVFDFTFNGECYRTETRAFCRPGKYARFLIEPNILECTENLECTRPKGAADSVKVPCGKGFTEDRARNLCVPLTEWD